MYNEPICPTKDEKVQNILHILESLSSIGNVGLKYKCLFP